MTAGDDGKWQFAFTQSMLGDFCGKALRWPFRVDEDTPNRFVNTGWHPTEVAMHQELLQKIELWEAKDPCDS